MLSHLPGFCLLFSGGIADLFGGSGIQLLDLFQRSALGILVINCHGSIYVLRDLRRKVCILYLLPPFFKALIVADDPSADQ